MKRIMFVCHGNICRSPMAEFVMKSLAAKSGAEFHIESSATSREEIGCGPHHGTVTKLRQVGIPVVPHKAVQMTRQDYENYDYLIGMDTMNMRNMQRIIGGDPDAKMHKLLSFTQRGGDVLDPWYTGNFDYTYRDVLEGCEAFLEYLGY